MGLFSSKKKTKVGTSISRVIEDKLLPNSIQAGTVNGVFRDTDIPMEILDELVSNIGVKAHRMYSYASKHYPYGLPTDYQYSAMAGEAEAKKIVQGIIGMDVSILYSFIGARNPTHSGWEYLTNSLGYDSSDNIVYGRSSENSVQYLYDMYYKLGEDQKENIEDSMYDVWGISANSGRIPTFRESLPIMTEVYLPTSPQIIKGSFPETIIIKLGEVKELSRGIWPEKTISITELSYPLPPIPEDQDKDVIHVCYVDTNGKRGYWSYLLGSGQHTSLDNLVNKKPTTTGEHFPFTYFRYEKTPADKNPDSPAYKISAKMLKKINMNYQEIIDAAHDNPDIKDVEQGMMVFTLPANTQNQTELRYIFDYFERMYSRQDRQPISPYQGSIRSSFWGRGVVPPVNAVEIRDSRFRMTLGNDGVSKQAKAGVIGPKGTYAMRRGTYEVTRLIQPYSSSGEDLDPVPTKFALTTHVYSRQTDTNMIEELTVIGLRHTYHIWGGHTQVGDEDKDILHIPLDKAISSKYPLKVREELYARSLHFVFNSRVTQKVKWYQTGFFKLFVIVVAVAIVVITQGAALAAWAGALASGGAAASAALVAMMKTIFQGLVVSVVAKFAAKKLGVTFTLILAAVMITAGVVDIMVSEGLNSAVWAGDLLSGANSLINATQHAIQDKLISLMDDYTGFQKYMEEATKTLDNAREMLYSSPILSPFILFGESPQDYYNRTVHTPNPGLDGIKAVKDYTKTALRLPTIQETLQGFNHGLVI